MVLSVSVVCIACVLCVLLTRGAVKCVSTLESTKSMQDTIASVFGIQQLHKLQFIECACDDNSVRYY